MAGAERRQTLSCGCVVLADDAGPLCVLEPCPAYPEEEADLDGPADGPATSAALLARQRSKAQRAYEARRRAGLCPRCGEPVAGRVFCQACCRKIYERQKERERRRRGA